MVIRLCGISFHYALRIVHTLIRVTPLSEKLPQSHGVPLKRQVKFLCICLKLSVVFFFFCEGAPQQMLRTHRSLKAYCATLWWRWAVFFQVLQVMEHQWNEIDRGKPTTRRKTCPSATLSTTNLTRTWPVIEPRASDAHVTSFGRAMAQAVSRRPFTAKARVRSRVGPCGICGGQNGTGTGFSPHISVFPCQFHSTGAPLQGKKTLIIFITGLHNEP
jgi:hypothetical protein